VTSPPTCSQPCCGGGGKTVKRAPSVLAEIFRHHADAYRDGHVLSHAQDKVLHAVQVCRTAALGGHVDICNSCDYELHSYNSCRNRHCPICQMAAQHAWIEQRMERVLHTHHFHAVFTLPQELRTLALHNKGFVYDLLMKVAAEILDLMARQRLGAQLGITVVLHTWTREMLLHPHVHCVVTGGGLDVANNRWVPTSENFLFPVPVLRGLFRKYIRQALKQAVDQDKLDLEGYAGRRGFIQVLRSLFRKEWVVYCKKPFAGPEHIYEYLGRYTHRVAISNSRILSSYDTAITFKTRGDASVTVTPAEFIRRFLLHVLPSSFHKIRHFGLYAATNVHKRLEVARGLLPPRTPVAVVVADPNVAKKVTDEEEAPRCPSCGVGQLCRRVLPRLTRVYQVPSTPSLDSS
jgi:Putative transposase/Transposase zinc-binding domain